MTGYLCPFCQREPSEEEYVHFDKAKITCVNHPTGPISFFIEGIMSRSSARCSDPEYHPREVRRLNSRGELPVWNGFDLIPARTSR